MKMVSARRVARGVSAAIAVAVLVAGVPAQAAPATYVDDLGRGSFIADVATGAWTLRLGPSLQVSGVDASVERVSGHAVFDHDGPDVSFRAVVSEASRPFVLAGATASGSAFELHASGNPCTAQPAGCVPPVDPPDLPCRVSGGMIVCKA